jgi:hypothetical protein
VYFIFSDLPQVPIVPSTGSPRITARMNASNTRSLASASTPRPLRLRPYAANHPGWMVATEFQDVMFERREDRPQYQEMLSEARHPAAVGHH